MAATRETDTGMASETAASGAGQRLQLNIRLQPANDSDHPIFSNFTVVQGAPGTVFVDFGFLDPSALPAVARLVQTGGKLPEAISGRLACRVALGLDAAVQLAQQLEQHLRGVQARAQQAAAPKGSGSSK